MPLLQSLNFLLGKPIFIGTAEFQIKEGDLFSEELKNLLIQVISSREVIAVTVVLVLYFLLVSYVSRTHRRSRAASFTSPKKKEKKSSAPEADGEVPVTNDDNLGLEE
jgi:hypothetical protein